MISVPPANRPNPDCGYTYIWEFRVRSEQRSEFERHYAPQGTWANLFSRAPGFIETILLEDESDAGRYLTIDRWQSKEQYRAFLAQFSREYMELDQECAKLTIDEKPLGEYRPIADRQFESPP